MNFVEFIESKNGNVTRDVLYPATDMFPGEAVKMNFYYYVWLGINSDSGSWQ